MGGEETVDLVDESDQVIGEARLRDCLAKGFLHRAVAVLVNRRSGRFLLQRRSRTDLWQPGLWTLSSTGHVKKGETYRSAAARELSEELGLSAPLRFVKKFLLPPIKAGGLTECEWVALYTAETDEQCKLDPVELEEVAEMTEAELRSLMAGGPLTPDARIILADHLGASGKSTVTPL